MNKKLKTIVISSVAVLMVGVTICGALVLRNGSNSPGDNPVVSQPTDTTTPTSPANTATDVPPSTEDPVVISKISTGDVFVVAVSADDIRDMYGYQLCVNYDKALFEYSGGLKSDIAEISLIFKSQLEFDDYILVGASKTGDKPGFNGKDVKICHMTFTAIQDCELADISISGIKIAGSSDGDLTDVRNWNCEVVAA